MVDLLRNEDDDQAAIKGLYDALLCGDGDYLKSLQADAQRSREGLPTGLILKERDAKGRVSDFELVLPKYAITVVGARTGGGKTTTMVNLAVRLALKGKVGMYITLEEPAYGINAKMLSCYSAHANPNHSTLWIGNYDAVGVIGGQKTHEDQQGFAKHIVRNCRVIDANASVDLDKIESPTVLYYPQYISELIKYRNAHAPKPLDFVFIDFGQLLESMEGYSSSFERIRSVMQALKNLSVSLGIAVIIGAQMKRETWNMKIWDWEPEMIRDGSDMEQAASLIIAVGKDKDVHDDEYDQAMRLLKNRHGPKRVAGMMNINWPFCFIPSMTREPSDDA